MEDKELAIRREKIKKGLELTYQNLLLFKKSKNSPLVVSRDRQIIELYYEDIVKENVEK